MTARAVRASWRSDRPRPSPRLPRWLPEPDWSPVTPSVAVDADISRLVEVTDQVDSRGQVPIGEPVREAVAEEPPLAIFQVGVVGNAEDLPKAG